MRDAMAKTTSGVGDKNSPNTNRNINWIKEKLWGGKSYCK